MSRTARLVWLFGVTALVLGSRYQGQAVLFSSSATVAAQESGTRTLSEQELKGEGLFLQRCSLCHLSKRNKSCCQVALGPKLEGRLTDGNAETEQLVRQQIRRGSTNMPGFQYGLSAGEIDAIIAYLKTL